MHAMGKPLCPTPVGKEMETGSRELLLWEGGQCLLSEASTNEANIYLMIYQVTSSCD